ncbi:MAG: integrin alpha [candidate division WOR-3 bacterium]
MAARMRRIASVIPCVLVCGFMALGHGQSGNSGVVALGNDLEPGALLGLGGEPGASDQQFPGQLEDAGWWNDVQRSIRDLEYQVTWQDRTYLADVPAAYHAPNRAHGFRTYFTEEGPRVIPRLADEPRWEWGLTLIGVGRGTGMDPVAAASLVPAGNRIEYEREWVREWYVNEPRGLEQGFILHYLPLPSLPHEQLPLALHLELKGDLRPEPTPGGQGMYFWTPSGIRALLYSELRAYDATGRELEAWMEAFNESGLRGIRLMVNDLGAVYPLIIDPLATSPVWSVEGDQAGAQLGSSVATAGDVDGDGYSDVIVGAEGFDHGQTDEGRPLCT